MPEAPRVRLTWRQYWWLPALGVLMLILLLWRVFAPAFCNPQAFQEEAEADEYNGFDLSTCTFDRNLIAKGAPSRDAIPPLVDPQLWQGSEVAGINKRWRRERHMKALVVNDAVIGLEVNGEARAYPVRILDWHEVVNDMLGGEELAITYCPLTASALVYKRDTGENVMELAASGLLYNSNTLLYDQDAPEGQASLYSQLSMDAVSGPAAEDGLALEPVPSELTLWGDWLERHPNSTVLSMETGYSREYDSDAYGNYYDREQLRFPVALPPQEAGLPLMERCVAVQTKAGWRIYTHDYVLTMMGGGDMWQHDGLVFTAARSDVPAIPPELRVAMEGDSMPLSIPGLWFALNVFMPDAVVVD